MSLTDEEIGKEFKLLWRLALSKNQKTLLTAVIRGYFNRGNRGRKLLDSLK